MGPVIRGAACAALLLAGLMALVGCRAHGLQARGFEPARSTEEALSAAMNPRRIAVVIGVDDYRSPVFEDLRFAASDARSIAALLSSHDGGGFDRVVLLDEPGEVARQAILDRLRDAAAGLLPDDTFVIYFSGHGTLARGDDGGGRLYLLPSDAEPAKLEETALDLTALRGYLADLPVEQKALIVDACFHGEGKSVLDPTLAPEVPELIESTTLTGVRGLASGEAHLFASSIGRPAFEDAALGHGVYTHYLTQAMSWRRGEADLDGDGLLTAWEAHDYARERTRKHTGGAQVAEAALRVVGTNDLLLAGTEEARLEKKRDHALLYDYGGHNSMFAARTLIVDGAAKGVFPGTVAIPEGRHHVEVRGPDGELELDGYLELRQGQSIAARDLAVLVREDRVLQAFRFGYAGGPAAWGPVWGSGFLAIEAFTALRAPRGPLKGLFLGGTVGGGVSPTRRDFERLRRQGRGVFWASGELGWGIDIQRFRLRVGWQARLNLIPVARFPGPEHELQPEETGWLFVSTGPSLHLGFNIDRRLSFVAVSSLHATYLDPDRTGTPRPQAFGQITAGWELGF